MPKTFKEFLYEEVKLTKRELTGDIHDLGYRSQEKLVLAGKRHDELLHSTHSRTRQLLAQHGSESHKQHLMRDPQFSVRCGVAQHGTDAQKTHLMKDKSATVRLYVAKYGNDKHRDHLMHDPHHEVRQAVAINGNSEQRNHLAKDPAPPVRETARWLLKK